MTTYRLEIAYEGSGFAGWAVQPGRRTVEAELESALGQILGKPVELTVAGRTDAGVHAWGQVASFTLDGEPPDRLAHRLNAVLSRDVAVLAAMPAAEDFDARRSARSRTYCYRLLASTAPSPFERGRALWRSRPLDRGALEACAAATVGEHDFTAFTPTQTVHQRFRRVILRCEWLAASAPALPAGGQLLELWIEADAFMRSMVRILVGTMLEVATGARTVKDFEGLLEGAPRERAGETALAHGLHLAAVRY